MKRALVLLLVACKSPAPPTVDAAVPVASASVASVAPVASASAHVLTESEAKAIIARWNDAHTAHDASALESLYAPSVSFYGRVMTAAACAQVKRAAFSATPDYAQRVEIHTVNREGNATTVYFTKTSIAKGKSTDFSSTIEIRDERIAQETDAVTEQTLRTMTLRAQRTITGDPKTCDEAVGAVWQWTEAHYPTFSKYPSGDVYDLYYPDDKTKSCADRRLMIRSDPTFLHSMRLYTLCVDYNSGTATADGLAIGDHELSLPIAPALGASITRLCGPD
jgi:hypothetical protein